MYQSRCLTSLRHIAMPTTCVRARAAGRAVYEFDLAPIFERFVSRVIPRAADHGVSGKESTPRR